MNKEEAKQLTVQAEKLRLLALQTVNYAFTVFKNLIEMSGMSHTVVKH